MGERVHNVDPEGDVTLVLRTDPHQDFAVWDENDIPSAISVPEDNESSTPLPLEDQENQTNSRPLSTNGASSVTEPRMVEIHYRVSSRHLILASKYFKRTLGSEWKEGTTLKSDGHVTVQAESWDEDALLIVMNIIHGHTRKVPRSIDLDMLAKVAVLVDYYQCHEVTELFADIWLDELKADVPSTYTRDLVLWLFISWVFLDKDLFAKTTEIASTQSKEPIQTLALPIPEGIVEKIDLQRQEAIGLLFDGLRRAKEDLLVGRGGCSFECDSILLGALTKEIHAIRPSCLDSTAPFLGFSFSETCAAVHGMRSPRWSSRNSYGAQHGCSLEELMGSFVGGLLEGFSGLTLESCRVDGREK